MPVAEALRKMFGGIADEIAEIEKAAGQPGPAQVHSDAPLGDEDELEKSVSQASRDEAVKNGDAFPDGSFPIRNQSEADKAWNLRGHNENHSEASVVAHIRKQVGKHGLTMPVSKSENFETTVDLIKGERQGIAYGVVLTPGLKDSQGDIPSADDIEKAAHEFLQDYINSHDVQHSDVVKDQAGRPIARTVESYVAPQDLVINGKKVLKGAWVMVLKVDDPATRDKIEKDAITGLSMAGTGVRLPD